MKTAKTPPENRIQWAWLIVLGSIALMGVSDEVGAGTPHATISSLTHARKALERSQFSLCRKHLSAAQKSLQGRLRKGRTRALTEQQMLLLLLRYNYHHILGRPPSFRRLPTQNQKRVRAFRTYLRRYRNSLIHLKQAGRSLKRLIAFFQRNYPKSVRHELRLESWYSLQRDVRQDLRSGRFRIDLLRSQLQLLHKTKQLESHQKQLQERQRRISSQQRQLRKQSLRTRSLTQATHSKVKAALHKAAKERRALRFDRAKIARTIARIQKRAVEIRQRHGEKASRARRSLVWGGIVTGLGLAGIIAGSAAYLAVEHDRNISSGEAGHLQRISVGVLIGSGVVALAGGGGVLAGIIQAPTRSQQLRELIHAQNLYLAFRHQSSR